MQIDVKGAKTDLHSGGYGGSIRNPAHVLAEMLTSMHDENGRIAVDGFYDDVAELTAEERVAIAVFPSTRRSIWTPWAWKPPLARKGLPRVSVSGCDRPWKSTVCGAVFRAKG